MADEESGGMPCTVCRCDTDYLGQIPLRAGGSGGFVTVVLGQQAEAGERIFAVDMYRCGNCGHVELYDLDGSLPGR